MMKAKGKENIDEIAEKANPASLVASGVSGAMTRRPQETLSQGTRKVRLRRVRRTSRSIRSESAARPGRKTRRVGATLNQGKKRRSAAQGGGPGARTRGK